MPAFDELRDELDILLDNDYEVNAGFQHLVKKYNQHTQIQEDLLLLQEQLESEGHEITWPDFI